MTATLEPRALGRYLFYAPIASGGMATVYLGRMAGPKGFSRIIAIKQLHARLVHDTDFVAMFLDEAQLIGRIHHSNVVAPIDVVEADGDLCIVMEYVHGEALRRLMKLSRQNRMPLRVVSAIMIQTLLGLHAAHEVTDSDGKPLSIVHRDVSPQNILVGEDGIARVVDFGIARAANITRHSDVGKLKGKLGYMAPEQLMAGPLDRRCDIFAAGIILWEMLTGKKLLHAENPMDAMDRMSRFEPTPPSTVVSSLTPELDAIALTALARNPDDRFSTAHDMARALEAACQPAGAIEVAEWVTRLVGDTLSVRAKWIADLIAIDMGEFTQSYVMTTALPPPTTVPKSAPPEAEVAPPPQTADGPPDDRAQVANNGAMPSEAVLGVALPPAPALGELPRALSGSKADAPPEPDAPPAKASTAAPAPTDAVVGGSEQDRAGPPATKNSTGGVSRSFDARSWLSRAREQPPKAVAGVLAVLGCVALSGLLWPSKPRLTPSSSVTLAASPSSTSANAVQDLLTATPRATTTAPSSSLAGAPHVPPSLAHPLIQRDATQTPASVSQQRHSSKPAGGRAEPQADCKVPYYYDAKHIKRYKLECFRKH